MRETPIIPFLQPDSSPNVFKVQTIQKLWGEQDHIQNTVHRHNYFEMIWITKGSALLYADMQEIKIASDSIFLIRPNQAYRLNLVDPDGYVCSFSEAYYNSLELEPDSAGQASIFRIFSQSLHIQIKCEVGHALRKIIALMVREYENEAALRMELLKCYFSIFIIYLSREIEVRSEPSLQGREAGLVSEFLDMLEKHFRENKMVTEYAEKMQVSPNYLNRIIKRATGFSAKHHIKQRVLMEAKRLGRYSDVRMKQIAYSLGFSDSAHFSKYFKLGSGANFSDFKNIRAAIGAPASFHRA